MVLCACLICGIWSTAPSSMRTLSITRCCASAGTNRTPTTWPPWPWMAWRSLFLFLFTLAITLLAFIHYDKMYNINENAEISCVMLFNHCQVVILDVRVPCTPVARLNNHRACVNGIAWAPHSSCHICTAG